jgi:4-hydroxyproline epimerase
MIDSFGVIDTHTGGEITRVLFADQIGLGDLPSREQRESLARQHDWIRDSLTRDPRGVSWAVGAVVTPATETHPYWRVVFFNNVGYLGMCGHGLLGVLETLRHRGLIVPGPVDFDTPAGTVAAALNSDGNARFDGVTSYCYRHDVEVICDFGHSVRGDIAYGGNWFYVVPDDEVGNASPTQLLKKCSEIRAALRRQGITGKDGAEIDHVELHAPHDDESLQGRASRNFVLCPGGHYDRSPCGTGTSAKLACMAERGQLKPGQSWIQESVTGSRFEASYQTVPDGVVVTINGRAHVIAESTQIFDPADPLRFGLKDTP